MNKIDKEKIEKRIEELKKMRSEVTSGGSKSKYNFCIGELQAILTDGM